MIDHQCWTNTDGKLRGLDMIEKELTDRMWQRVVARTMAFRAKYNMPLNPPYGISQDRARAMVKAVNGGAEPTDEELR